jgi:DNA-binding transcriptional ArsR family regulator
MPKLSQRPAPAATPSIEFVVSVPLDLMNAMYFTSLVEQIEGVDGWPLRLREEMAPDLLEELDFLYNYPAGDPGLMGTLGDNLFANPQTWRDVGALLAHVQGMTNGIGDLDRAPGIQGLIYQATFRYPDDLDRAEYEGMPHREAIERRIRGLGDRDTDAVMGWYDRPAELRERMVRLIQRFYSEHYEKEMPKRLPVLQHSVAVHRGESPSEPEALARKLTSKRVSCLEGGCAGPYQRHVFAPSMDMGVYNSCAIVGDVHGLFYPCEPEFMVEQEEEETRRLARIYKALADEQRLKILRLLREREMYAQEIVDRTGLHQSVVSRHLTFMKAVGLLDARRQQNMKFFSINPAIGEQLGKTLDLFVPASPGAQRTSD